MLPLSLHTTGGSRLFLNLGIVNHLSNWTNEAKITDLSCMEFFIPKHHDWLAEKSQKGSQGHLGFTCKMSLKETQKWPQGDAKKRDVKLSQREVKCSQNNHKETQNRPQRDAKQSLKTNFHCKVWLGSTWLAWNCSFLVFHWQKGVDSTCYLVLSLVSP